jgi:hypothetical protein
VDSFYVNEWFAPWLAHFRQVSTGVSWQALVTEWVQYEALKPPDGVSFLQFCLLFCFISIAEVAHGITSGGSALVDQAQKGY